MRALGKLSLAVVLTALVLPALLAFAIVAWNTGFHSIRRIRFS